MRTLLERLGRRAIAGLGEVGLGAALLFESAFWIAVGARRSQPVRFAAVLHEAVDVGVRALPIVGVLSLAVGVMLAMQGIYSLRIIGAESQVTLGVGLTVTREFAPLITGILVAGRSGSALAARIATMKINEEISALIVMGINPVRYLVAPALLAMLIMLPALTWFADCVALLGAGLYINADLGLSLPAYLDELLASGTVGDLMHGLGKSLIFAVLITLIGVINGQAVSGGAEGVGRMTTRSVVHSISAIVVTDMLFVFITTR